MKNKKMFIFKMVFVTVGCGLVFFFSGFLYLNASFKEAETKNESIPYTSATPENAGVFFKFDDGHGEFFYLDFDKEKLFTAIIEKNQTLDNGTFYGYPVTYTINADYTLISGIIDAIDGIELTKDGETLRYTGIQVVELISVTPEPEALIRQILPSVMLKISDVGLMRTDFVYMIENSKTNLKVPDCYYWQDYIKQMCKNYGMIN